MKRICSKKRHSGGFTLIETIVVVAIFGLLATIVLVNVRSAVESARYARAQQDLRTIEQAARMHYDEYNEFPPDAEAGEVPEGMEEFLSEEWPGEPWRDSYYDWNYWETGDLAYPPDPDEEEDVVQISIRFCPEGGTIDDCRFPRSDWAEDFDVNSAVYRCISGPCRAHKDEPPEYPAHCINC